MSLCLSLSIYIHTHTSLSDPSPNLYIYPSIHACMHACIHPSIHACMHAYMHTYVYTPSPSFFFRWSSSWKRVSPSAAPLWRSKSSRASPLQRSARPPWKGPWRNWRPPAWRIRGNVMGGFDDGMGTSKSMGLKTGWWFSTCFGFTQVFIECCWMGVFSHTTKIWTVGEYLPCWWRSEYSIPALFNYTVSQRNLHRTMAQPGFCHPLDGQPPVN